MARAIRVRFIMVLLEVAFPPAVPGGIELGAWAPCFDRTTTRYRYRVRRMFV
jgi:hypothetical protein